MKIERKKVIWVALATIACICIYLVICLGYWFYGKDNIYPRVQIAGLSVSGMSNEEVKNLLNEETEKIFNKELKISNNKLNSEKLNLNFDITETINNAKSETSKNPFLLGFKKEYPLKLNYNEEYLYDFISSLEKEYKKSPENSKTSLKKGELIIIDGKSGQQINYSETVNNFEESVGSLSNKIDLSLITIPPTYTEKDLENRISDIQEIFENGLTLKNYSGNLDVPLSEMVGWVELESKKNSDVEFFGGDYIFDPLYIKESGNQLLSTNYIEDYLGNLSKELNTEPVNAQLSMKNGKVSIFSDSKDGKELDISQSAQLIKEGLKNGESNIELLFKSVKPDVYLGSLNDLGISELIATGYSNFSGSPSNRRHNIRVGASKFNGLLIKPGETFSFTTNLGNVDAKNGYLPELVIKNNETTPEYGGGLCQVSSTAFRAALNAGLPIVARKAHSYPVSYYKPYGTDATIYIPNPDLKFKNDTKGHVLIQTRIVGNYLYFDFYGTNNDTSVKFAGNKNATGAVSKVEWVTPYTYGHGGRGEGSFKAIIYRFIYDKNNKLLDSEQYLSNYDSPDKYPH